MDSDCTFDFDMYPCTFTSFPISYSLNTYVLSEYLMGKGVPGAVQGVGVTEMNKTWSFNGHQFLKKW